MKTYNQFERQLGKMLDAFPQLRQFGKNLYQRFNYWYFGDRNFQLSLHPKVKLLTPAQWIGSTEATDDIFFGYYDKSPWSPDMEKAVFHRLVNQEKTEIMVFDSVRKQTKIVGKSATWNLQQGSMVQWLPGKQPHQLIFNVLDNKRLAARMVDLDRDQESLLPWPIQTLHPQRKEALTLNYKRLDRLRPEYGYAVDAENFDANCAEENDGIWLIDLDSKKSQLLLNLASLMSHQLRPEMESADHKVNHIIYSPTGGKFVFMHRWIGAQGKFSRLYVADSEGRNLRLLLDDRMVSHYSWQDDNRLLTWARTREAGDHYYLIDVESGQRKIVGEGVLDVYGDGHPSFSPNRRWIITDSYPDRARQQHLLLFEVETGKLIELGKFLEPLAFSGPNRCDLHPRWSPDGNFISIDSSHEGKRKTFFLDITAIVNR